MGSYNYQVLGWPAQPRSKKRREANITSGGGTISSGGGADVDLSGYIRIADLIKTTSDASVSEFLDTNAMSSLMVKTLLDQKANTIHDHSSQLIRPAVMVIPQIDPSDAGFSLASGEVAEFISHDGSFAEPSGSVTPADLKDLTLKINGVTQTTYNPASQAQFNVDLTSYAQKSWVEAKNYLQGITKAMVEAVLTGNITSHTHSQYLTAHQSLSGYATQTWVQQQGYLTSHQSLANYYTKTQADAKFLTEHQSLENYALKSEIPTSMAWTDITGRPTKLSQFTNDIISSWALAATKPSYSWSEIGSRPSKLSQFTNDILSDWALATTKPSYTLDEVTDGSSRKLTDYVLKAGDTMTGNLVAPSVRVANTYYGISFDRTTATPVETILYTGIKWVNGSHMPVLHITGFAYGLSSPVEFKIGFYLFANRIGWCGVTNMGSWAPRVYLFKYTNADGIDCVAVGLAGSCYFLQLQADVQDEMGKFAKIIVDRDKWSWSFLTTTGTIPATDGGTTCIEVPYKADILSLAWSKVTGKPTSLSGYGITDGYSSLSTTGNGNAITGVSGSGHALTFTKGNTFVDLASEQTISGKKHISYLDVTGALAVPQVEPSAEAGKVFEYIDNSGSFGEAASAITPADLKDLVLKINGVTKTTYNPSSAASFNVDLTDYATQDWVEAKNYLQAITKAMVEAVLTGNITSHTHSQYLTSHQSLSGYATQTWVQQQGYLTSHQSLANYYTKTQADAKFLTEHQSLENYALKSEIPTSMAWTDITGKPTKLSQFTNDIISSWALAATKPSYSWSEIGSRPTKLSQFTNDILSSWALASTKPAYSFSELNNKPTTLAGYGILDSITFSISNQYVAARFANAEIASKAHDTYIECWQTNAGWFNFKTGAIESTANITAINFLGKLDWSYIQNKPTKLSQFTNDIISSWALAASKPSYSWTEITSRPTTLASFSGDSTHRLVTDTQISNWNSAYGWGNHADAGYLTSFTESDPTVPAWAKTTTKPSYTLDEVTDGSTRKLSNYVPTTRTINSKALSSNITLTLDDIANGTNRSLANYLPLSGGTLTGYVTFDTSSDKSIYANNGTLNQRMMLMSNSGNLLIGYDLPGNSKYLYLDGYQTYLRFGSSKNYSMTLWSDGTIRSSTGTNMLSIGYRSGNVIYPFKYLYGTYNVATKCSGTLGGIILNGIAKFNITNTKKARTFALKIPAGTGATTYKIIIYSPYNLCPSSTITVSTGGVNLTAGAYCALYPSYSIEGSFAGRVAFARDGNTTSSNMYILLGSYSDISALYQAGMVVLDQIIHTGNLTVADTVMNFGYELLDLDDETMFTKITECANADAHFKSVTVEDHVTAPKIDCTSMMLVPTIEPSSVPAGKVAEYIDLTGSFAN